MADTLLTGIRKRRADALNESYFPDGMPEDWRMDYLATMSTALWLDRQDDDIDAVLSAVAEAPRPVALAVDAHGGPMPEAVLRWQTEHPGQIVLSATDAWHPDTGVAGAAVGLIPASDQPAVLRGWIEQFAQQAPEGTAALFVDGDPPSTATLDRVQALIEMMGLA